MSLLSALHGLNVAFNPFYANPIVGIGDMSHLNERDHLILKDPHLAICMVGRVLMARQAVIDAMAELYGALLLEVAVTKEAILVNVYDYTACPGLEEVKMGYRPLNTANWPTKGIYYYTAQERFKGTQRTYKTISVEQERHLDIHYDRFRQVQSWTIPLTFDDKLHLGIA